MPKDQLSTLHSQIIGVEPNDDQKRLYASFTDFRGYSDDDLNSDRFEAIVLLSLSEAAQSEQGVLVFAPPVHEGWVIRHFNELADRIFTRCKSIGGEATKRIELARAYQTMFERVHLTGKLMQIHEAPARWVSFGFKRTDPLPDWVPDKLLEPPG